MGDVKEKLLPGTATAYVERGERGFSKIEMLLDATGGLSLSQVCAVTGLEGSTIQNWVKRGWVAHPAGKKYEDIHIARILIINALKECIKLEHIALLMSYVNGSSEDNSATIIRESELYNFLCDALQRMGQASDHSRSGVETVVETVIRSYKGPKPDSHTRIRKVLTVMIFACVCTDVKRRTEAMMEQILYDLENPESIEAEDVEAEAEVKGADIEQENAATGRSPDESESMVTARKTVSQALREWDFSSVERIVLDPDDGSTGANRQPNEGEKTSNRPWYVRKGSK